MESIDLAHTILDEARTQIQANMALHYRTTKGERWINASGRSSAAFQAIREGENRVLLVYRGANVAPFESIEHGSTEPPTIDEAASWREAKEASGAEGLPNPESIVLNIEARGGTERHFEPQEWIVTPVVEAAVLALNEQLPKIAVKDIKNKLFE